MDMIYHYVGLVFVWASFIGMLAFFVFKVFEFTLNIAGEHLRIFKIMVEFAYYYFDFIKWVKDKERLKQKPKTKP